MAAPLFIADVQSIVLSHIPSPLPAERRAPPDALGARLASDVKSQRPHPPFPAAIKDGFAVASAGGAGERKVVTASRAGAAAEQPALSAHEAAYVTTGAPMPPGTDAVIQIESVKQLPEGTAARPDSQSIAFGAAVASGSEVRGVGSDIALGATVLHAHERIGPAEVGLLATIGCQTIEVHRAPRVGVLSTGDELVDAFPARADDAPHGAPPVAPSGRIFDCNRPMLLALSSVAGGAPTDLGMASDVAGALEAKLDAAIAPTSDVDVLICSGGVSMGDRDLVKPLLATRGTVHFGKVVMKPGKPLTFATVPRATGTSGTSGTSGAGGDGGTAAGGGTGGGGAAGTRPPLLVFALPGNPVSAFACFHLIVAPALRKLAGDPTPLPRRVQATLASPFKMDPERPEYHRAVLSVRSDGSLAAHSTGGQISSRLLSCRAADALVELPARAGSLPAGTVVTALLIGSVDRGAGMASDALTMALQPTAATAAPAPVATPSPLPPSALPAVSAACSIGVLVHATSTAEGEARAASVLDMLGGRLAPGSWLAAMRVHVAEGAPAAEDTLRAELESLCDGSRCSAVLCLASPADSSSGTAVSAAVAAARGRLVGGFGSLMRSACMGAAGGVAASLLGDWKAGLRSGCLVVSLPAEATLAMACVDALLPSMGHALSQAGERPPLKLRG